MILGWKKLVAMAAMAAAGCSTMALAQQPGLPGSDLLNMPDIQIMGTVDPNVRKATAIVNGSIITDTDVDHRLGLVLLANDGQVSAEERQVLRLQVLRNLIDEMLQIQAAAEDNVRIADAEVEQAFQRVAKNFRQDEEQFQQLLRTGGSSPASIKQQIRGELAWNRLLRKRVEPFVNVGDDEVQGMIRRMEEAKGQEEYRVGEIFLSAPPEQVPQMMTDAQRIVEQVRQGASFVAYARQFSEASTAALGGDLGWVRAEQLSPALQGLLPTMQRGSVSDPVAVPGGVTIIALIEKRQVLAADPANALLSLKQLTLPLDPNISETAARQLAGEIQKRTQAMGGCGRADAVARDIGASVVTNDQLRLGDLPGPLQEIMRTLPVGGATPPFGSAQDGLRVLVLCGRDDPQTAGLPSFDDVYGQLNEQRVNSAARRFLRDLRRDAVIEYR